LLKKEQDFGHLQNQTCIEPALEAQEQLPALSFRISSRRHDLGQGLLGFPFPEWPAKPPWADQRRTALLDRKPQCWHRAGRLSVTFLTTIKAMILICSFCRPRFSASSVQAA